MWGLVPLEIFVTFVHPFYFARWEFLGLMITSVYCSIGIIYVYVCMYIKLLHP